MDNNLAKGLMRMMVASGLGGCVALGLDWLVR